MLYKNYYRTKLAKKWYAYCRIVRKCGDFTFTFQHVGTVIEMKVHANDIKLEERQNGIQILLDLEGKSQICLLPQWHR